MVRTEPLMMIRSATSLGAAVSTTVVMVKAPAISPMVFIAGEQNIIGAERCVTNHTHRYSIQTLSHMHMRQNLAVTDQTLNERSCRPASRSTSTRRRHAC